MLTSVSLVAFSAQSEEVKTGDTKEPAKIITENTSEAEKPKSMVVDAAIKQKKESENKQAENSQTDKKAELDEIVDKVEASESVEQPIKEDATTEKQAAENTATENANEDNSTPVEEKTEQASKETAKPQKGNVDLISVLSGSKKLIISGYTIDKPSVKQLYQAYQNKLIWFSGHKKTANSEKAYDLLDKAFENGLSVKEFDKNSVKNILKSEDKLKFEKADVLVSDMVIRMINQIANGKPIPQELGVMFYPGRKVRITNITQQVINFISAGDVDKFIIDISPKHAQYFKLRDKLKEIEKQKQESAKLDPIPTEGPNIVVGSRDYRIPFIKEHLKIKKPINPAAAKDNQLYDQGLKTVIVDYQKKLDIKEDGVIGQKTINALNTSLSDIEIEIRANMERYRWLTDNLAKKRIEINLAAFELTAYEDNKAISKRAVIVGRAEKKTALMETVLTSAVLNPFWHAPRTYSIEQLLPILRNDQRYPIDQEIDILKMTKDGWQAQDPLSIDWNKKNAKNFDYLLRQRPGKKNVLGAIKFNITNTYDIYLHSTTEPWLFSNKFKAYSSGCIRVEKPDDLAKWMLKDNTSFDMGKFDEIYHAYDNEDPNVKKPNMVNVPLTKALPTYIVYFTVEVDDKGELIFHDDLYKWDSGLAKAWGEM